MTPEAQDKAAAEAINREAWESAEQKAVKEAMKHAYRLVDDGVEIIGGTTVAAGVCGIDHGDLRRSINRDGRRLALDHAVAIATRIGRTNPGHATRIAAAIVLPIGLLVFPRTTLTDKERADRYEAYIRSMPLGDQHIANALGGTR